MARIIFTLEDGTQIETELDADTITIGRHPDNNVELPSHSVSSQHATVRRRGDGYFIQDLGSTNGTKLNGVEVEEARLEHGDQLSLGDVPAVVQLEEVPRREEAVPTPVSYPSPSAPVAAPTPTFATSAGPGSVRRPMPRPTGYRPPSDYEQGSGCVGFIGLLLFLALAFIAGMCLRHAKDHGGFLLQDLYKKYTNKSENAGDVAPAKPADTKPAEAAKPSPEPKTDKPAEPSKPAEPAKPEDKSSGDNMMNK